VNLMDDNDSIFDFYDPLYLAHYGTPRHSGRYPWGSGDNPYQSLQGFYSTYTRLKNKGWDDTAIAKSMGYSTKEFRDKRTIAMEESKKAELAYVRNYLDKGWSVNAIARKMGRPESSIRNYKSIIDDPKLQITENTANVLKDRLKDSKYIDIGLGTAENLGITQKQMDVAIQRLKEQGYSVLKYDQPQASTVGQYTPTLVLAPPGTTKRNMTDDIYNNKMTIGMVMDHSTDGGKTFDKFVYPTKKNGGCLDPKRVEVVYTDENGRGGAEKDGLIELRPGLEDMTLGGKHYAQVRINVDGTHYAKGMCVYANDLPDGIDIRINSNKHEGTPMLGEDNEKSVLKNLKPDKNNPYGSSVIQRTYIDKDGNKKISPLNIVGAKVNGEILDEHAEGGWENWKKSLASQFLSKQSTQLAKSQLNLTYAEKKDELNDIEKVANPQIRKMLLDKFASGCDKDSYELKAAALPNQTSRVLIPFNELKDNECYAPDYKNGEKVILVRYPHASVAEIPTLTVNNTVAKCRETLGTETRDAIGINHNTATVLSGADFDGDTAIVIPVRGLSLKTRNTIEKKNPDSPLLKLKDFNPSEQYPYHKGMKVMDKKYKGIEMGKVTNLISDMTLKGATDDEIARAIRYSMCVIDAEKHKLDYKQCAKDNNIDALRRKYQTKIDEDGKVKVGGSSTLISRAKGPIDVNQRRLFTRTDPDTGEVIYVETGKLERKKVKLPESEWTKEQKEYHDRTGKPIYDKEAPLVPVKQKSKQMLETNDARTLSSGTDMEEVYAQHANRLKSLANKARLESLNTKNPEVSKSAQAEYKDEIESLEKKYREVLANKPRERRAQSISLQRTRQALEDDPDMDEEHRSKTRAIAIREARAEVGSTHSSIDITPREWQAISNNAIPPSKLNKYLESSDLDQIREYALPKKDYGSLSTATIGRINAMRDAGYTIRQIADSVGVSTSTVSRTINGE